MTSVFDIIDMLKKQNGGVVGDLRGDALGDMMGGSGGESLQENWTIPSEDDNAFDNLNHFVQAAQQRQKSVSSGFSFPGGAPAGRRYKMEDVLNALTAGFAVTGNGPGGGIAGLGASSVPKPTLRISEQPALVKDLRAQDIFPITNQLKELNSNSKSMLELARAASPLSHGQRERIYTYTNSKAALMDALSDLKAVETQSKNVDEVNAARESVKSTFGKARDAEAKLLAALHPPAPAIPHPSVDIQANVRRVKRIVEQDDAPVVGDNQQLGSPMKPLEKFYKLVKSGGPWDYKRVYPGAKDVENFGNWHYGYVAAAMGLGLDTIQREAGFAQIGDNNVGVGNRLFTPSFGKAITSMYLPIGGEPPYGDDYTDNYWIRRGYNDYLRDHPKVNNSYR